MPERTNLTVAKICHELANYLSVLNFIREDIVNEKEFDKVELVKTIELLTHTMDFFRNIYSDNINYKSMILALKQICSLKGIVLSGCDDMLVNINEKVKCVVYGLLYTIIKISKTEDVVNVSKNKNNIVISLPQGRTLPRTVSEVFSETIVDDDIFNVFANYINEKAERNGYGIKATDNEIVVWKK